MNIHPTAIVDPGAVLGKDVTIGPYVVVAPGVEIGDACTVGPHAVIHRYTSIGAGCRIHAGAILGDSPQDLSFAGDISYVRIGRNCVIREGVTINRGTKAGSATIVGDGCYLMANSHLGHNVKLGDNVIVANGALLGGYVAVGDRAFLSGHVLIHQFTRVGRLAMLSGGAGISKDVPPFCTVHGVMTNTIAGLNLVGLRRAGFSPDERQQVKHAFDLLYRSGLNVTQAVAALKKEFTTGPAAEWAPFIEASKRGICAFGSGLPADGDQS
jgi:UDP-N-acetylglucosamine acyltransferase